MKIEGRGKAFPHIKHIFGFMLGLLAPVASFFLYILAVIFIIWPFKALLALDVVWIDSNTVQISGVGNEWNESTTVVTNYIGTCTNCVAISRSQLDVLCDNLTSNYQSCIDSVQLIQSAAYSIEQSVSDSLADIITYRRWQSATTARVAEFTNYTWTVENGQTSLVRQFNYGTLATQKWDENGMQSDTTFRQRALFYSNGIYDYANQVASPQLSSFRSNAQTIVSNTEELNDHLQAIQGINLQLQEVPICSNEPQFVSPNGGTNGSGSVGCAWTEEQARAVVTLLGEIKTTLDSELSYLQGVSNRVAHIDDNIRAYGEVIKNALYQGNGTIRVSSSETPLDIYETESASLYDYNHSNILQRIELLLYNLGYSSSTNNPSDTVSAIEDTQNQYPDQNDIDSAKDSALESVSSGVSDSQSNLDRIKRLWTGLLSLLQNLNGSIESVGFEAFTDDNGYTITIDDSALENDTFKTTALTFLRLAFGVIYWFSAAVFVYFFYLRALKLGVFIAKWASEIISTLFNDV